MYHGDIALGATIDIKFTTRRFSTGAPFTLAGTPVVSAYIDNSVTQLTAGITLSVDFDSVTGLNNVRVVATSGNGYAAGTNVQLVITTGTVDSVSVVGEVIGSFSIEHRSALRPTVAARTLDVSSTGEAGLDWANIGSPTTAQTLSGTSTKALEPTTAGRTLDVTATGAAGIDWANVENPTTAVDLSATNIDVDQVVASVSGAVGSVTGAVGSVTGNVGGNVTGSVGSVVAGVTLAASAVQAIWDALTSALTTVGSIGKLLVDNVNATISSRAAQTTADAIETDTQDIQGRLPVALTGGKMESNIGSITAGVIAAASFAAGAFDAVWTVGTRTLTSFGTLVADTAAAVWAIATATLSTAGTIGKLIVDNLNATVSSRASQTTADAIEADTQDLQTQVGVAGAGLTALGDTRIANLDATVSSRATPAQVNTEVLDVLNVDTFAEPTGVPPATSTLVQKLGRLYMALRNGLTVTATDKTFLDDGGAGEWKKALSDDGTTYTEGEGTTP